MDICAPQVVFPDDFQSGDPMLVVVDLGRILLTNSQGKTNSLFNKKKKSNIHPNVYILWLTVVFNLADTCSYSFYLKMTLRPAQKLLNLKEMT